MSIKEAFDVYTDLFTTKHFKAASETEVHSSHGHGKSVMTAIYAISPYKFWGS